MNHKAYYLHFTVSQSWLDRFDSTAFSAEHWYCPVKITKVTKKICILAKCLFCMQSLRPNSWTKSRQKSFEFFSLLFTVTSTALPWDLYFFKFTQPLKFFFKLTQPLTYFYSSVTLKEKGGKPGSKLYPLF
jgi:hypothetical protein